MHRPFRLFIDKDIHDIIGVEEGSVVVMAAEPKRPPPPKSYVPLTLLDGPPALPPRPSTQNGASSIRPHTPNSPTGEPVPTPRAPTSSTGQQERRSESPVPVKPARHKTKRGHAQPPPSSQPATVDGPTTANELKENIDSPGPPTDSIDSHPPVQQARRHTFSKSREKPPTPPPYAGQSPVLSRALSGRKKEEKESNHVPASPIEKITSNSRPAPPTPPPYAGQSPILNRRTGIHPSPDREKEKDVPSSPAEKLNSPVPIEREGEKKEEGKRGRKGDKRKDRERERPPAPVRPARASADGQELALAKPPTAKVHRPPPSRPSKPPAANTPPPESLHSKDSPPKPRPRAVSASSPASSPKSGRSPNIHKRDAKPEISIVSVHPMLGDSIPSPSLSRRMTAPSRPLRKHPGPPPPRKSTPPSQNSPPTPQKIESPDITTSSATWENADPPRAEHEEVTRKSPPPPQKPPREPAKPGAEEAQKGKRPPPPRPGSRPPPPTQGKKAPPPATRPAHPPSIKKRQSVEQQQQQQQQQQKQQQQQQQQDELERKLQELGPPPTEEPPELPPEASEADLSLEPLPSRNEPGPLPHPTTQELPTPQPQPPSSPTPPTPGTTDTPTPHSPLAPRKPPKRPTQPPPPKHSSSSKEILKGQADGHVAGKDKNVEVEKQVKPTAPARKSLSAETRSDVLENQSDQSEKVADTKQEALATKPMRPSQRPPPPKVAKHREEGTEPPSKAAKHREEGVKSQEEANQPLEVKPSALPDKSERPPVKQKASVPGISPSPEVKSPEAEKQERLPQVDKPPVARKPSVPRATPPPSPDIATSEGEKKEERVEVENQNKLQLTPSNKLPSPPEVKQAALATKPTRPAQRPPPPKVAKHQDEGMRPAQRPPPPKVAKRQETCKEAPVDKHQVEPEVETNQPPEEKPPLPATLKERPPVKRKPSVPRLSPSPEVISPESEKQEKPSVPRATPPPSPDIATSEGEKKDETMQVEKSDKPQLTRKLTPPEAKQEALTTKPAQPAQRPPPPKVVKHQDEGMRPAQRPPPPKVAKCQETGIETPVDKHQVEPEVETNQPPEEKHPLPATLKERPPVKRKPSVPRISSSPEVISPESEKQEKLPQVDRPRKPSVPRATPPPSPDIATSEGENKDETTQVKKPDKPQLTRKPSNKSPPPPEAKQEALATKPVQPAQRPPPPKVAKHQEEGMIPTQRPPPPKHREGGIEPPAKPQVKPQKATNRPPEDKPALPSTLPDKSEKPLVKRKPSVPRISPSPSPEVVLLEGEKQEQVDKPPVARKPSVPRVTPPPSPDIATSEGEKKETTQVEKPDKPQLTRKPSDKSPPPPEVTTPKQPQDDQLEKAEKPPSVKRPSLLKKSQPPPESVIPKQPEDDKPKKPEKPPPAKRPSPLPKKSPPTPEVADPEAMEGEKEIQVKKQPQLQTPDKPSVARRPAPISKKSPPPLESAIAADGKPEKPEELKASSEKLSTSTAPKDHEDEKQAEDKPEKLDTVMELPDKTSSGLPPREQRKVERKEREELKGGGDVEMVRVIRTSEGVTEQLVSSGGGSVDQAEGGGEEREEHADIDPTTTTVKLREKPSRPATGGDKNPEGTKRKPPRPLSMPPGHLPGPKPASPSQKPTRPPSLIMEKPGRPAPPSRPSQKPPAKKTTSAPRKDSSAPPQLPPRPSPGHPLYRYVCSEPHGLALTVHDATTADELSYQEGDVIELIERLDEHWFFARNADNNMMDGVVPAKDLKIIKRLPGQDTVAGFEEGPCAVATHTFQGEGIDELSFKEGDLIMLKTRVDDQWLRGKLLNGVEGIFPKSFVEIVEDLPESAVETPSRLTAAQATEEIRGSHCVALHPFTAEGEGELSIVSGDTIELLEKVGTDWLKGRKGQAVGIFPSQFVEIKVDLPPPPSKATVPVSGSKSIDGNFVTAVYDFDGQDGELSFKTGEKIKVTARVNEEWVRGELGGQSGIFPASFVDAVPPNLPSDEVPKAQSPASPGPSADTKPTAAKATGKCEALFDFTGENSGELSFSKGEVIVIKEWVNDDWLSGQVEDREGMFPVSFVKVIEELPKAAKASAPTSNVTHITDDLMPKAVALSDYNAGSDQEISFKEGDVLYLLNRVSKKRYLGENTRTDQIGEFPSEFVNVVVPLP